MVKDPQQLPRGLVARAVEVVALGIAGDANGALLWGEGPFCLWDDGIRPGRVETSLRIGISKAVDLPWRWFDADDENVSR